MSYSANTIALKVNGKLTDLNTQISTKDKVEEVSIFSDDGREILKHSTSHVLAQAVQNIYKDAKIGMGPAIENGYYYDFLIKHNFEVDDLGKIEKEMLKIVNQNQKIKKRTLKVDDAIKEFKNEPLKIEIIKNKSENEEINVYENISQDGKVMWKDICLGPHIPSTKCIKNFYKLTKVSSAYWLGDSNNQQLQRIYGIVFPSKEELKEYLQFLADAKNRDHKTIGKNLDLFSFPEEVGTGNAIFHPKGTVIKNIMIDYSINEHKKAGYQFVSTPHIGKGKLFNTSGHLDWYKEYMYPAMIPDKRDDVQDKSKDINNMYFLKPMNCPMHNLIYKSSLKSYKQLPLKLFEFGNVYRYELSGVVNGLIRARGFTQDDAHIYCTEDQVEGEIKKLLQFVIKVLTDFGLNDYYLELSTRDEKKYVGSDKVWRKATEMLKKVATSLNVELKTDEGGAAFYGPKISVQVKDALTRTWQISTIQIDFNLPELFNLKYTTKDGIEKRPIMIHRALFGSVERFFAILLEHYNGLLPIWLAPVQVKLIPVTDGHIEYLQKFLEKLKENNIRAEIDDSADRFGKKIRNAIKQKIPLSIIVGDNDKKNNSVSFRYYDGKQKNEIPVKDALTEIVKLVGKKT